MNNNPLLINPYPSEPILVNEGFRPPNTDEQQILKYRTIKIDDILITPIITNIRIAYTISVRHIISKIVVISNQRLYIMLGSALSDPTNQDVSKLGSLLDALRNPIQQIDPCFLDMNSELGTFLMSCDIQHPSNSNV